MQNIIAIGELLMDCVSETKDDALNFKAHPGGAPCNVLSMAAKLGSECSYIAKVGDDDFGHALSQALQKQNIHTEGVLFDETHPTTLAFVMHDDEGDRSFSFYREGCADTNLHADEIRENWFKDTSIFHFGSLSLTCEPARSATKKAIEYAKKHQCIISFDPNLRLSLWNDSQEAKAQILQALRVCDILKVSEEELQFLTGMSSLEEGIAYLKENFSISLILLTLGKEGSRAYCNGYEVTQQAFLQAETIDTTGAGDTFLGCILAMISKEGIPDSKEKLQKLLYLGNAAASIITSRKGALCEMPTMNEILTFLASYK